MANEFKIKLLNNSVCMDHKIRDSFTKNKYNDRKHIVTYDCCPDNKVNIYKTHNNSKIFFKSREKDNFTLDISNITEQSETLHSHRHKISNKQINRLSPNKIEFPTSSCCYGIHNNNLTCVRRYGTDSYCHDGTFIRDSSRFTLYNYVNYPYVRLVRNQNFPIFFYPPARSGDTTSSIPPANVTKAYACHPNTYRNAIAYNPLDTLIEGTTPKCKISLNNMTMRLEFLGMLYPVTNFTNEGFKDKYDNYTKEELVANVDNGNVVDRGDYVGIYVQPNNYKRSVIRDAYKPYPFFNYHNFSTNAEYPVSAILPYESLYNYHNGYVNSNYKRYDFEGTIIEEKLTLQEKCFLEYSFISPILQSSIGIPTVDITMKGGNPKNDNIYVRDRASSISQYIKNNMTPILKISDLYDYYDGYYKGTNTIISTEYRAQPMLYSYELKNIARKSKGRKYDCSESFNWDKCTTDDFRNLIYQYYGYSEPYGKPAQYLHPCATETYQFDTCGGAFAHSYTAELKDMYILYFDLRLQVLPSSSHNLSKAIGLLNENKKERVFFKKHSNELKDKILFIGKDIRDIKIPEMKQYVNSGELLIPNKALHDFICSEEREYFDRCYYNDNY
jgi:hypothetical protein